MSEVENRGLEEDLFRSMTHYLEYGPVYQLLGVKPRGLGNGWAKLSMLLDERHCNIQGKPHGGLMATVVDAAMGSSVGTAGRKPVTADFTIHFIHSPRIGQEIMIEAEVVSQGSRLIFTKAVVTADDLTMATAQGCFVEAGPVSF